jgi:hypothetical protein
MLAPPKFSGKHLPLKIAEPAKQGSPHYWKFSKLHTGPQFPHGFQPSIHIIRLYKILHRQQAEVIQNRENEHVRSTGQGEDRNRK